MADFQYCPICGNRLEEVEIEHRKRMRCSSKGCEFVSWDNPVPVVAAVVEHQGKVLLARNRAWPEKIFGLITGFLEKGEAPDEAVLREVHEELGLNGEVAGLIGVYPFIVKNQVIIAYHVLTHGDVTLSEELVEFKLIPIDEVRPWPFGTGQALADWLEKKLRTHT